MQYIRPTKSPLPATPLTSRELVTDHTLRQLAKGSAEQQCGMISDEDQAILVMILPDICGELLARRAAMLAAAA